VSKTGEHKLATKNYSKKVQKACAYNSALPYPLPLGFQEYRQMHQLAKEIKERSRTNARQKYLAHTTRSQD
jgi:hypothetical protein